MPVTIIDILKAKNAGTFPITEDIDQLGGFRVVADATERDDIPTEKRKEGMWVAVLDEDKVYTLVGGIDNDSWVEKTFGGGGVTVYATEALLLAATPTDGTIGYATDTGRYWNRSVGTWLPVVPGELLGDVTLAVSTTGNDSDPARPSRIVLGDWTAYPFLTIQAAIDSLPHVLGDKFGATINVGAGNFAGFRFSGFMAGQVGTSGGGVSVVGTRQLATLASGVNTGTATSGGKRTLTRTGAGWTVDNLAGKFLNITSGAGAGQILMIASNTATTITLADTTTPWPGAGSVFRIEESATVITSLAPGATNPIEGRRCFGRVGVTDVKVTYATSVTYMVVFIECVGLQLVRVLAQGNPLIGGFGITECTRPSMAQIGSIGSGSFGINLIGCTTLRPSTSGGRGFLAMNASSYGIQLVACAGSNTLVGMYARNCGTGIYATGAGTYYLQDPIGTSSTGLDGMTVEKGACVFLQSSADFSNNTLRDGIHVGSNGYLELTIGSSLTGSGNGTAATGWGLDASDLNATVVLYGTPTITGFSGAVTVDSYTDVTWANLNNAGSWSGADGGGNISRRS